MKPIKLTLRQKLCHFVMSIAEKIHSDCYFDICVDTTVDTGDFGYCDDCDQRRSDEPSYCR